MDARQIGFVFGFLFSQLLYVLVFAFVIGALIYFLGGKKRSYMKTVFSWKALLPALLIVGVMAFVQFAKVRQAYDNMGAMNPPSAEAGVTAAAGTGWNAEQTNGFNGMCGDALKSRNLSATQTTAICGCVATAAQKQYASFTDLEKAMVENRGVPESIKESMLTCVKESGA